METTHLHRVYCLHGVTGQLLSAATAGQTTLSVTAAVVADVTIVGGAAIVVDDGKTTSGRMVITGVDSMANTLTVSPGIDADFPSGSDVVRAPHWAEVWKTSMMLLTECPEDSGHAIQAGSAHIADTREPNEVVIRQCDLIGKIPELHGRALETTGTEAEATYSFAEPEMLLDLTLWTDTTAWGDTFDVLVSPIAATGTLTLGLGLGATVLTVDEDVIAVAQVGMHATVSDMTNTDRLGLITAVDDVANTITVESGCVNLFLLGASVRVSTALVHGHPLPSFQTKISVSGASINKLVVYPTHELQVVFHNSAAPSVGRVLASLSVQR